MHCRRVPDHMGRDRAARERGKMSPCCGDGQIQPLRDFGADQLRAYAVSRLPPAIAANAGQGRLSDATRERIAACAPCHAGARRLASSTTSQQRIPMISDTRAPVLYMGLNSTRSRRATHVASLEAFRMA